MATAAILGVGVLVIAVVVFRSAVLTGSEVESWARVHGLALTPGNTPMVAWYLRTASTLRTLGVVAGLFLPGLVVLVWDLRGPSVGAWQLVFVGYLLGALYAEIALVRPRGGRALLVPRRLRDYLPRRVLHVQRAMAAVLLLGAPTAALLVDPGPNGPDRAALLAATITGGAVAGLEVLQRWIIRRPQPLWTPPLVSADDAIRSQSVHSIAGSGIALGMVALTLITGYLAGSEVTILRQVFTVPTLLIPFAAIFVCLHYGHRRWRVTRFDRRPATRATC
jgi:hypothetical protein